MIKTFVTWDLGATKCAAAIVEYDEQNKQLHCIKQASVKIRNCSSLEDLVTNIESLLAINMANTDGICIGAAGQFDGEKLLLDKGQTDAGYPYPMEFAKIARQRKWPNFAVIHDYSPIVCATFTSYINQPENVLRLNNAKMNPFGRRVALGIGTGVGMKDGILFANGNFWLGTNEIGHIGVVTPPLADKIREERHHEFIKFLRSEKLIADHEPLTFEKVLAGNGLVRIHSFFDRSAKNKTAEDIGTLIHNGLAPETFATFAWYLGLLVGTTQLIFMPDGGIWITGGIILNHQDVFKQDDFYLGIEASPTYLSLRQEFPLGVLRGTEHAFMGGAYYASKCLLNAKSNYIAHAV